MRAIDQVLSAAVLQTLPCMLTAIGFLRLSPSLLQLLSYFVASAAVSTYYNTMSSKVIAFYLVKDPQC